MRSKTGDHQRTREVPFQAARNSAPRWRWQSSTRRSPWRRPAPHRRLPTGGAPPRAGWQPATVWAMNNNTHDVNSAPWMWTTDRERSAGERGLRTFTKETKVVGGPNPAITVAPSTHRHAAIERAVVAPGLARPRLRTTVRAAAGDTVAVAVAAFKTGRRVSRDLDVLDVQLAQLLRIDGRGRVAHQIDRLRRLRERNHLANR